MIALLLALAMPAVDQNVLDPAGAIALADAHPNRASSGTFRMRIAETARTDDAVFLNSSDDYRAPGAVTFAMRPIVAKTLEKRFGAPPETYLRGRTVTVRDKIRARAIANLVAGRPHSLARWQYTVPIQTADQIIAVE